MFKDFRNFVMQGNVVDLAIGIVIGTAIATVARALVADLFTPLFSIPGTANFENLQVVVHHSVFRYGDFLNSLLAFVFVAFAMFFLVVRPITKLGERLKQRRPDGPPETKDCPECCSTIPYAARRCPACTSSLEPVALGGELTTS